MRDVELEQIVGAVVAELRKSAPELAPQVAPAPLRTQAERPAPAADSGAALSDIATREYKKCCGAMV